jgi:hypothetical protein
MWRQSTWSGCQPWFGWAPHKADPTAYVREKGTGRGRGAPQRNVKGHAVKALQGRVRLEHRQLEVIAAQTAHHRTRQPKMTHAHAPLARMCLRV